MQRLLYLASSRGADVNILRAGRPFAAKQKENVCAFYTNEPVEKGKTLAFVPSHMLITDIVARKSPLLAKYAPWALERHDMEPMFYVALFVFLENVLPGQDRASVFAAYYASLPRFEFDFDIPALFWGKSPNSLIGRDALNVLLTPSSLNSRHLGFLTEYDRLVSQMHAPGGLFEILTVATDMRASQLVLVFRWATAVVMTRGVGKIHPSIAWECALVPVIGMDNREEGANSVIAVVFEPESNRTAGLRLVASEDLPISARIYHNYDLSTECNTQGGLCRTANEKIGGEPKPESLCAEALLFRYGFLPTESSRRTYCLDLSLHDLLQHFKRRGEQSIGKKERDAGLMMLRQIRRQMFDAYLVEEDSVALVTGSRSSVFRLREGDSDAQPVPPRVLALLRISQANMEDVDVARQRDDGFMTPVGIRNERHVLNGLHEFFSMVLAGIPSSAEEDGRSRIFWEYQTRALESARFEGLVASRIQNVSVQGYSRMSRALFVRMHQRRLLQAALRWADRKLSDGVYNFHRTPFVPVATVRLEFAIGGVDAMHDLSFKVTQPGQSDELQATAAVQFCAARFGDYDEGVEVCVPQIQAVLSKRSRIFYHRVVAKLLGRRKPCLDNRLMIVAHPDDEAIFGASELTLAQERKGLCWTVVCVTHPRKNAVRLVEFQKVMDRVDALGIVLTFIDGIVPLQEDPVLVGTLSAVTVSEWLRFIISGEVGKLMNWTRVVTHGPMGEYGHPQHVAVHRAVRYIMREASLSQRLWVFQPTRWNVVPAGDKRVTGERRSDSGERRPREMRALLMGYYTTEPAALSWLSQLESIIVPLESFDYGAAAVGCDTEGFQKGNTPSGVGIWTKRFRWLCRSWIPFTDLGA